MCGEGKQIKPRGVQEITVNFVSLLGAFSGICGEQLQWLPHRPAERIPVLPVWQTLARCRPHLPLSALRWPTADRSAGGRYTPSVLQHNGANINIKLCTRGEPATNAFTAHDKGVIFLIPLQSCDVRAGYMETELNVWPSTSNIAIVKIILHCENIHFRLNASLIVKLGYQLFFYRPM